MKEKQYLKIKWLEIFQNQSQESIDTGCSKFIKLNRKKSFHRHFVVQPQPQSQREILKRSRNGKVGAQQTDSKTIQKGKDPRIAKTLLKETSKTEQDLSYPI